MLLSAALAGLLSCATGAPLGGPSSLQRASSDRHVLPAALTRDAPTASPELDAPPAFSPQARSQAVTLAQHLVGKKRIVVDGKRYPEDCTGLIRGVFGGLGVDVMSRAKNGDNGVTAIYRYAQAHGRIYEGGWPVAGDIVFFRETYDLNRDGRINDGLTHIGLVESVLPDGTVTVIHRVARGVVRYHMNLEKKNQRIDPATGQVLNDYIRPSRGNRKPRLTSQLFAGYATLLPVESRFASR